MPDRQDNVLYQLDQQEDEHLLHLRLH